METHMPSRRDFLKYTGAASLAVGGMMASSDLVNEDEIKRITGIAADIAKASAIAKKIDVKLAAVPAYTEYWSTPLKKDPTTVSQEEKQTLVQKVVDAALKVQGVTTVNASVGIT